MMARIVALAAVVPMAATADGRSVVRDGRRQITPEQSTRSLLRAQQSQTSNADEQRGSRKHGVVHQELPMNYTK